MERFFLSISFIFFCILCTAQSIKVQDSKDKRIIDFDKAKYPDTRLLTSTLYKSAKIIPLETNKSCLIGDIGKIQVIDDFILIMDFQTNSLYVFDREGRFIRKIGGVGQGPGEYGSISDFTIDRVNKTVYIKDGRLSRIHKYDIATGKFIQTIVESYTGGASIYRLVHSGGNLYTSAMFENHSPDNFLLYSIDESSGKEKNNFLNVMKYSKGCSNIYGKNVFSSFFSRQNGDAIFFQPLMNHVIEITKDGVFSLLEFKGKNMMTHEEAKKLYDSFDINNFGKNSYGIISQINKYTCINSYVEKGEKIYMEMIKGFDFHSIVVDRKTNEVCVYTDYRNDDVLYRASKGTNRELEGRASFLFGCSDSHGVYRHVPNSNGVPELQKYYNSGILSPDIIGLEKIKELRDDDNPILIYYEFKD